MVTSQIEMRTRELIKEQLATLVLSDTKVQNKIQNDARQAISFGRRVSLVGNSLSEKTIDTMVEKSAQALASQRLRLAQLALELISVTALDLEDPVSHQALIEGMRQAQEDLPSGPEAEETD